MRTHCEWQIYSPATKNRSPVSKLLSAACGSDLPTIESSFGVAETSTRGLVQHLHLPVIRLWCARAKNFQSALRKADAAPGSRFPAESMCQQCSVAAPGI